MYKTPANNKQIKHLPFPATVLEADVTLPIVSWVPPLGTPECR